MKKSYKIPSKFFFLLFFVIITHCSFFIAHCEAQPSITWQRLYDSPVHMQAHSYGICDGLNGNFYIVGDAFTNTNIATNVIKINSYGDTIWNKIYNYGSRYSIVSLSSGACVIAGTFKINPNGDLVWTNSTDGESVDIIGTSDGGFIQCGSIYNFNGYVQKIDSIGNTQWEKILQSGFDVELRSVVEAADGGYLVYGTITDVETEPTESYLVKLDVSGNILWEKRYQLYNTWTTGITINKVNQGYILGGNCNDSLLSHGTTYILRVDKVGNEVYWRTYLLTGLAGEYLDDLSIINNNRYVMAINRVEQDSNYSYISSAKIKIIDSLGNQIREKSFYAPGYAELLHSLPIINGDILFTGYADLINNNRPKFYTVRTDSLLNVPPLNGISLIENSIPKSFVLFQNFPNPFNPVTRIRFDLPVIHNKIQNFAQLKVYDLSGREVAVLYSGNLNAGSYEIKFDATGFASSVYIYTLFINNSISSSKKMVLLK